MYRGSKLIILLLALVLVLGGYLLLRNHQWEDETKTAAESVVLSDRAEADIASLRWTYNGESCTLRQTDGVWADPDDAAFPVDQDVAVRLASAAATVKSDRALGTVARLSDYGLAAPALRVEAVFTDGSTAAYDLGDANEITDEYYAAFDGQVYLLDSTLPDAFSLTRWELIASETLPAVAEPTALELRRGERTLKLVKEEGSGRCYSDEYVWFCDTDAGLLTADTEAVLARVDAVTALDLSDVAAYNASDKELADWGLDGSGDRVTVRYQDEGSARALTLELGREEESARYLRLEGSRMVYRIPSDSAASLLDTAYSPSLLPDEVCRIDINSIQSLDVELDGESRVLYAALVEKAAEAGEGETETGEAETEYRYTCNGTQLNAATVRSALAAIYAMTAQELTGELSQASEPLLTLTYHRNAGVWSEMTLRFYAYGAEQCLVEFNGAAYQLCSRSAVDTVLGFLREALGE